MASVDKPRRVRLKKGEEFVSKFGTNLRLTIQEVDGTDVSFIVERRVVDRKTGEISVEERNRTVTLEDWRHVEAGYVRARSS